MNVSNGNMIFNNCVAGKTEQSYYNLRWLSHWGDKTISSLVGHSVIMDDTAILFDLLS